MDLVLLLLVFVAPVVQCYSSGLVMDSCDDMQPHHNGLRPQTGPSPFTVTTEHNSYGLGKEVKVQLQAPASTPFTGFLLQAREVGRRSPVGSFATAAEATRLLTCSQIPASAVSHRSKSATTSIQVRWRSEASGDMKAVQFHASFVQSYMTFWVDVTSPTLTFTNESNGSTGPPTTSTISRADCGVTKACFSQPSNCDPAASADCYFLSAMMLPASGGAVRYEMSGPSNGYISFGFSDDQMMGDDDIYICGISSSGLVRLQHAFSTGRTTPQALPLGNVSEVKASMQDSVISCSFTSMNTVSTQRTSGFNKTYHLMFAHGPSDNGQIQLHTGTFTSTDKVDISKPGLVRKAGLPHIIKAHGALMLIAWMTTGSLGMMAARYLRGVGKNQKVCGKEVWFVVHVAVMSVTVAATITAFILSFSYVKEWSEGVHPVLGCLVLILSTLQPILALLRCGPQHPLRSLFYWSHALNGLAMKAISVAAIFTGLKLVDSTDDRWLIKVMGGFLGWEVLFCILLEVHLKWKVNSQDSPTPRLESRMITVDVVLMALFFLGNLSVLVALLVGIGKL
ncbi:putative ferric-chelate reductase 1 [Stegastes partitus]|uniref:Ferric-chelate reductase 1 n=1 Tax=Stegastes partitus TaxID=144197 RepID=A0A9Y4KAK9_9TELE|nr:PREDICTED: putative ferric-chelate reductase 1 [Stegastes partitus]